MGVVRGGEAAAGHEDPVDARGQERPVRDAVDAAPRDVAPRRVAACVVVLDRGAAERDLVGEPARLEHVIAGQPVVAEDAPALADADRGRGRHHGRALEAGHALAQEPRVLLDLAAALHLGPGERFRVHGVHARDARHVDQRHALVRRAVPRALDPGQAVGARLGRLAHQRPELALGHGRGPRDVHVGHLEQRGERLDAAGAPRIVVAGAREVAQVRVARGVHDRRRLDPALAALGPQPDGGHPAGGGAEARFVGSVGPVHADAGCPGVQQQVHARLLGQALPEHLEHLRVVRHARPGAVRVRPLERHARLGQPRRHFPAEAPDHAARRVAGRVERVEGVEHRGGRAAHEGEAVHEQGRCARSRRGDRGRRAGRPRAHDDDVVPGLHAGPPDGNA